MNQNMAEMKQEIVNIRSLIDDLSNLDKTAPEMKETADKNTENIAQLTLKLQEAKYTIKELQHNCHSLKEQQLNLDTYMRRDNLIFDNNPEEEGERWNRSDKIKCFLKEKLTMSEENVSKMKIVRCHRLGCTSPNQKRPRSIICRFHYFGNKQAVWEQRSKLAGKVFRLSEDFP